MLLECYDSFTVQFWVITVKSEIFAQNIFGAVVIILDSHILKVVR